jgi:hypothetical protein
VIHFPACSAALLSVDDQIAALVGRLRERAGLLLRARPADLDFPLELVDARPFGDLRAPAPGRRVAALPPREFFRPLELELELALP